MLHKTIITTTAAAGLLLSGSPAFADDKGLYGAGDPTFDGVYRQSVSIMALTAAGQKVPASAVTWLKNQQCADGSFMAYRADVTTACGKPDPLNFSGEDTNSTAFAAAALWTTGNHKQAKRAVRWLAKHQNADSGWAYYPAGGATSDTNSTALAYGAVKLVRGKASAKYLRNVQLRCPAAKAERGAMAYDTSFPAVNDNATAQAAWTLTGGMGLPAAKKIRKRVPKAKCDAPKAKATKARALTYLHNRLVEVKGALPFNGYPGTDYQGASWATLALANDGSGRKAVKRTTSFLAESVDAWAMAGTTDSPGALAILTLVAESTDNNPKDFGGTNLIKRLKKTQTQ